MESEQLSSGNQDHQNALVYAHVYQLRRMILGHRYKIITIIESNLSAIVAHGLSMVFDQFPPVYHMRNEKSGKIGVVTTNEVKLNAVHMARYALHKQKVYFYHTFVTVGRRSFKPSAEKQLPETIIFLWQKQMNVFREETLPPKTPFGRTKRICHGKIGRNEDDLAIAFLLGMYWSHLNIR